MKRYIIFVLLTLLFASCSLPVVAPQNGTPTVKPIGLSSPTIKPIDAYRYIGLEYPPIPSSIIGERISGKMISPSRSSQDWGVDALTDGHNLMLWLSKVLYHDKNGKAHSQVSDVVVLPPPAKDQDIVVSDCLLNGVLDPEIVAVVKVDEENHRHLDNSHIVMAWRANQSTGKLEPIAKKGIECYGETFLGYPKEIP